VAQQAPGKPPQVIQQIMVTNRTRVLDTIFMKHGLKAVDLARAVEHYNLEHDPDVESIKKANKQIAETFAAQQQRAQQDLQKDLNKAIDDDFRKGFEQAVKDLGRLETGPDGLIKYEVFLKIQQLIGKFVHESTIKRMPEHKSARREFLRGQQEQKY
jgi:flagellar biosynthesis/type III secretory pathway protein FliH